MFLLFVLCLHQSIVGLWLLLSDLPSVTHSCSRYTARGRVLAYLSLKQLNSQLHFRVPAADLFHLLLQNTRHILPPPSGPSVPSISYNLLASPSLHRHTHPQTACLPASGGNHARGGWVTLTHQLHCLHPEKHQTSQWAWHENKAVKGGVNEGYRQ